MAVILILPYNDKITTNYKISYFGFNFDRKSTYRVFYVIQNDEIDLVGCLVCAEGGRRDSVVADAANGVDVSVSTTCVEVT